MKAARIHRFGAPDVVVVEEVPRPAPAAGELLIRVAASGVGPWDALIREGKSKVSPPPPLTLGSDLSGVVEEAGPNVSEFKKGDEIYGVTNPQFCGANAQYAVARGVLVSVVSTDPIRQRPDARSALFYAEVTTERLNGISRLFYSGQLTPQVGTLLPLNDGVGLVAHERGEGRLDLAAGAGVEELNLQSDGTRRFRYVP